MWHIREAGLADLDSLALIGSATFLETFAGVLDGSAIVAHCKSEHSATAYRRYLASGAFAWLAEAKAGAAPVGFALLQPADLPGSETGDLELKRIYILSRFRGTGLGAELMQSAVDWALQNGASRLLLGAYARNDRALAFYSKNGFKQIATRRFRVADREYDDLVLARSLAAG